MTLEEQAKLINDKSKNQLLDYIQKHWETVFVNAQGGPYIVIDVIPHGHDGLYQLSDFVDGCEMMGIDWTMFTRSYPMKVGDGIRMNRYMHYMQETTKQIMEDLKVLK